MNGLVLQWNIGIRVLRAVYLIPAHQIKTRNYDNMLHI